jgi:hypothetical protein
MHRQLPRNSDQAEVICNQIERGMVVRAQANQVVKAVGAVRFTIRTCARSDMRGRPGQECARERGAACGACPPAAGSGREQGLRHRAARTQAFEFGALADLTVVLAKSDLIDRLKVVPFVDSLAGTCYPVMSENSIALKTRVLWSRVRETLCER